MTYPKENAPQVAWTVAEAKAKFSEMMDCARTEGPQTITKNGRAAVVMVSAEEWKKKTERRGSLVDFLAASPLRGVDIAVRRKKDPARPIRL